IRRMRGGSQSHLMRCSDGKYYVVKFQNNPQGKRILANELIASRLGKSIGLPMAETKVIYVGPTLIHHTDELTIQLNDGFKPCQSGNCVGSRHPGSPGMSIATEFVPDIYYKQACARRALLGALVFDTWTANIDWRQLLFHRKDRWK